MHGFINFLIVLLRSLIMLLYSIDLIYTRLKLREQQQRKRPLSNLKSDGGRLREPFHYNL